ncbi:unnamed protein product, partial [Amoebophrya sp. A25]
EEASIAAEDVTPDEITNKGEATSAPPGEYAGEQLIVVASETPEAEQVGGEDDDARKVDTDVNAGTTA